MCQLYVSRDMFGDGISAWCEAYDKHPKSKAEWNVARSTSGRLLRNVAVCKRINELLEKRGLNSENVGKQHLFLLNQHLDLKTKMAAVKVYYDLQKKIAPTVVNNLIVTLEQLVIATGNARKGAGAPGGDPQLPPVQGQALEDPNQGGDADPVQGEPGAEVHGEGDSWPQEGW